MKKLVLTLMVLLTISLSTAVVGGPKPGENEMTITSTDASATTNVGPNGTQYNSYFSVFNATQTNETRVINASFDGNTASFNGVYRTPTPCYELNHDVKKNENTYKFQITSSVKDNQTCAQVVTYYEYEANFTSDQAYKLNITYDGVEQKVLEHPNLEEENRGFLAQLLGVLLSLFVS